MLTTTAQEHGCEDGRDAAFGKWVQETKECVLMVHDGEQAVW